MYTLEIRGCDRYTFQKYLADERGTQPGDVIKHYIARVEFNDNDTKECILAPGIGEYPWLYNGHSMKITVREEGKATFSGTSVDYFMRILVEYHDKDVLAEFVTHALTFKKPLENQKIKVYFSKSKGFWEHFNNIYAQPLDKIYIEPELKTSIMRHIETFIASKERYIKYGRAYKLNFLLSGVCGSGKSSLIKAIALKYGRPLYVLSFTRGLTDETLIELMAEVQDNAIILVEDIDAFFVNRESKENITISFSMLLNIMDGVMMKGNGTMMFLTANNPEHLDQALIRPGRIDRIIKFDYPRMQEIKAVFADLTECLDDEQFQSFYKHIKGLKINMSSIIDYLFRYPTHYLDNINELLTQTQIRQDIINDKSDKMYI